MAGPLSSQEIEDVVSSVRRLVSNEQSPRPVTRDLNADRLLLTPALRVVSQIDPLAPLILDARLSDAVTDAPLPDATLPNAEPADTDVLDAVGDAPAQMAAPEALDDFPAGPAEPEGLVPYPVDDPEIQLIEVDWEDDLWLPPEPGSLVEAALGADEAEILISAADDTAAELASGPKDGTDPWAQGGSDWIDEDAVPFIPLRRRAESLAARVASGEVLAGSSADLADAGPEADIAEDDDLVHGLELSALEMTAAELAAFTLDPEIGGPHPVENDARNDARAARTQRMPTEILDADGTPLAVLDEAALQDIVRLMIREELQGSLGERITRNVRKLVRAEINRALVARDLD